MTETVGFIGLGIMGKPMALNLLRAGYQLVVHNRSPAAVEELVAQGASRGETPRDVAERSEIIITMLPDSPDVEEVVAGTDGVLAGAADGALIIDMSTISPATARRLAEDARERRVGMLDAPVSGGDVGAQQGTLSIMVGGEQEDFERGRPLFDVLGKTVTYVGPSGTGQVVKACNQIVVALTVSAVAEALVLGSKAGVAPDNILKVLSGGLAGNRVMEVRGHNFLNHDFTPGFKVDLHHKDLGIALAAAREYGASVPMTAVVDQMMQALHVRGLGQADHSALLTLFEDWAQHTIGQESGR